MRHILFILLLFASPATAQKASYYSDKFEGRRTANGEIFSQDKMTAAHKSLPFGTKVRVTHKDKSVVVRINDRGPVGRTIDLSKRAARALGIITAGVVSVKIKVLGK